MINKKHIASDSIQPQFGSEFNKKVRFGIIQHKDTVRLEAALLTKVFLSRRIHSDRGPKVFCMRSLVTFRQHVRQIS